MASVSISKLKAELSRYLRTVRRGGEVEILDRGVPVARLVGVSPSGGDRGQVRRLVHAGVLRAGRGDARSCLEHPPVRAPGADVSGALDEDRADRT